MDPDPDPPQNVMDPTHWFPHTGLEPMLRISGSKGQYLNVRQHKLSPIIIHILQHDDAVTGSLSESEVLHGQPNQLLINLARQYGTVPFHLCNKRGDNVPIDPNLNRNTAQRSVGGGKL